MNMSILKTIRWVVFFVVLSIVPIIVMVFLVFLLVSGNIFSYSSHEMENKRESYNYKTTQWYPETNSKRVGFVTMYEELKDDEYLTYMEGESQVLISNFGIDSYTCTGSCFCDDDTGRRTSMSLLGRGITTLLAAVSAAYALELAKDVLSSECKDRYSDVCALEAIVFDAESCTIVDDDSPESRDLTEEEETSETRWFCKGTCMENLRHMEIAEAEPGFWDKTETEFDRFCVRELTEECSQIVVAGEVKAVVPPPPETKKDDKLFKPERIFKKTVMAPICYRGGRAFWDGAIEKIRLLGYEEDDDDDNKNIKNLHGYVYVDESGTVHDWNSAIERHFEGLDYHTEEWDRNSHCTEANPPDFRNPTINCIQL